MLIMLIMLVTMHMIIMLIIINVLTAGHGESASELLKFSLHTLLRAEDERVEDRVRRC